MRNIKTKQYIQTLKTKDKRKNLAHFIKQQTISSKQNITASKEENERDMHSPEKRNGSSGLPARRSASVERCKMAVTRVSS